MTNKPMLSVERDERADFEKEVQAKAERFQPDFRRYGLHPDADYKCANNQWAWELWQKRASMDKPAVQRQGEPVGYVPDFQVESFLAKRGRSFSVCPAEWSNIEKDMPLYAEQPAPVADHTQCEECKGWGYHENHHEGGGTECGECGGSGNSTVAVAVVMPDVDELAQIIRKVDGSHTLGAGSLAEAIIEEVSRLNRVKP